MGKGKRRVAIQISEEALLQAIGVNPDKFSLARVHHEYYGTVKLIIDGESLPHIAEGQEPSIKDVEYFRKLEENR